MNSMQSMNMGIPQKKKTHRGRKPSTKPGADHLSKLTQAHGANDHHGAKVHALNYAKAMTKHMGTMPEEVGSVGDVASPAKAAPVSTAPAAQSMARMAMMKRMSSK